MKRSEVERSDLDTLGSIKQYSSKDDGELSQESLKEIHDIVNADNVAAVRQKCQESEALSKELLEYFVYAVSVPQAEIASTILQKFSKDQKIESAMEGFDVDVAYGGAIRVIKQWTAEQSKDYKAAYAVFEKDSRFQTFHYSRILPEILHHSLPIIWESKSESYQDKIWPVDMWGNLTPLHEDEKKLAATAIGACIRREDTVFTTQPAKFMECFIHAAVTKAVETRLREAKEGKLVLEKNT